MKYHLMTLAISGLLASTSYGWVEVGRVLCHTSPDRNISAADVPVPAALVVVTNVSGTFSNASLSDSEGFYSVTLPEVADRYGSFLALSTLPLGSTVLLPEGPSFEFSLPQPPLNAVTNIFLIQNPACLPGGTLVTGLVQCVSSSMPTNGAAPVGLANVLVSITNLTGSFSNATLTAANGSFVLAIPRFNDLLARQDPLAQIYVETLAASTLPANSTILFPQPITNIIQTPAFFIDFGPNNTLIFTSASGNAPTGNWLVQSPSCQCLNGMVSGKATIRHRANTPEHTFGGSLGTATSRKGTHPGQWTHMALGAKWLFRSTAIQSVSTSIVPGPRASSKSAINMAEFSGQGTLKGIRGNPTNYTSVFFTARVEDHGQPGRGVDRYYLRVYAADGTTLLLVSGNPADPSDVAPVAISTGQLTIRPTKRSQ